MIRFVRDPSLSPQVPFTVVEVNFPDMAQWDCAAFEALKNEELARLKETAAGYDRAAVFGNDSYFRYFRRFKKTYPVLMQLESFLLKDRPFPHGNPILEVAFLAELKTRVLLGTHDMEQIQGNAVLFSGTEKQPFCGMGSRDVHIYPGDVSGRDDLGIILSMIAGADDRTCIRQESRSIAYLVFGTDDCDRPRMEEAQKLIITYARTLAPTAGINVQNV